MVNKQDLDIDFSSQDEEVVECNSGRIPRKKPRVVKEWEEASVYKLISLVESEKCLWDAADKAYHNKKIREQAWRGIVKYFHSKYSVVDLVAKWTNLRIQYRGYAGKVKTKSGQGVVETPKWRFYNAMSFVGRAEDKQTAQTDSNPSLSFKTENNCSSGSSESDVQITPNKKQPGFCTPSVANPVVETTRESVSVINQRREDAADANNIFANYLASELKTLNPQTAATVRRKVNMYFLKCLEEETS